MSDRPTHPDEGEEPRGSGLLGDVDPWASTDSPDEPDRPGEPEASGDPQNGLVGDIPFGGEEPAVGGDETDTGGDETVFGGTETDGEEDERRPIRARDLLDQPESDTALPHWADPPTGEVPRIFGDDTDDSSWASVSASQPRWRDQSSGWEDTDLSDLTDDLPRVGGRDESTADEFFTFDDESLTQPETYTVPRDPSEPYGGRSADPYATERVEGPVAGRNIGLAAVVGAALAAVGLFLLNLGPAPTMARVVVVLVLASAELMATLRRVGYSPPALVALTAGATLPLASYWRGEQGLVLGVVLVMFVLLLWYLLGIGAEHAVSNIGVTMLTVVYVGVFGSFAALLLRSPHGTGLLLAALLGPIAYDITGLFVGRSFGRSPLSVASPNKTVEGTVGGMLAALLVTWLLVGGVLGPGIAPFDSGRHALVLGLVLAVLAPLADLCESMLKRDLNVKDMGTLLPGHGGVLDRFDTVLVSLPATYYVALVLF